MRLPARLRRTEVTEPEATEADATWFWDHYRGAAGQVVEFLGQDGLDLEGKRVADVGCGDGLIDLGICHLGKPELLVGYDLRPVDTAALTADAVAHGVATQLPEALHFMVSEPCAVPAEDDAFDFVVSWSAFEHVHAQVAMAAEIRRILRPEGVLFLQLWPFFHTQHGSHLQSWFPQGFTHLQHLDGELRALMGDRDLQGPGSADEMFMEYQRLNRIRLDDLQRSLMSAGLRVAKAELLTHSAHIPSDLAHLPLSELLVAGVKLLAVPVR